MLSQISMENFLLVSMYINDISFTYYDDNIFDELHGEMLTFCVENKPVLLIGNLTGRTMIYTKTQSLLYVHQFNIINC